jgi:hypothetical protein
VEGIEALKPIIFDYFANLFSSEVSSTDAAVLDKIQTKVTPEMNDRLLNPFSAEDV